MYKLLSSIWQDTIFFFISNRKTLIFTYFYVRGTHSLKLPLRLRSTRIFTLYVQAPIQIHSDPDNVFARTHSHTLGDNALQWGLRWPKAAKHLQKILSTRRKKIKKVISKNSAHRTGWLNLSYFCTRLKMERLSLT